MEQRKNRMVRSRSRIAPVDSGHFSITVSAFSAYIATGFLDPSTTPRGIAASSPITFEGALDTPGDPAAS
jgi:hypothetical protein